MKPSGVIYESILRELSEHAKADFQNQMKSSYAVVFRFVPERMRSAVEDIATSGFHAGWGMALGHLQNMHIIIVEKDPTKDA